VWGRGQVKRRKTTSESRGDSGCDADSKATSVTIEDAMKEAEEMRLGNAADDDSLQICSYLLH
jgi:hypothetical protein